MWGWGNKGKVLPVSMEASPNWLYMARYGCFTELSAIRTLNCIFIYHITPKSPPPPLYFQTKRSFSKLSGLIAYKGPGHP